MIFRSWLLFRRQGGFALRIPRTPPWLPAFEGRYVELFRPLEESVRSITPLEILSIGG
jgi:hypothetical protein